MHIGYNIFIVLFILTHLSCIQEQQFVDTTKVARQEALSRLQKINKTPDSDLRKTAIKEGIHKDKNGDIHLYKLRQTWNELAKENCFNIFTNKNRELAIFFNTITNAQIQAVKTSMDSYITKEKETQSIKALREKALKSGNISRKNIYGTPEEFLRFVLYLDKRVKPQLREDSLYLFLRKQLLSARPALKREAKDVFEIYIKRDSLFIEDAYRGMLPDVTLYSYNKTTKRLRKWLKRYVERDLSQGLFNHNRVDIAPDFYAKIITEEKSANSFYNTNSNKSSDTGKINLREKATTSFQSPSRKSSPFGKNICTIFIDSGVSINHLPHLIEFINSKNVEEFQITTEGNDTAQIICKLILSTKQNINTTKKSSLDNTILLEGVTIFPNNKSITPKHISILYLSKNSTPKQLINALNRASHNRTSRVYFDTSGTISSMKPDTRYMMSNNIISNSMQFKELKPITQDSTSLANKINAILGYNYSSTSNAPKQNQYYRPHFNDINKGTQSGGRSRANVMRTVRKNLVSLKKVYNKRLRAKPSIKGKITVKWAIDNFGNVLYCKVVHSTMKDRTFEKEVIREIKTWHFGKINIPSDVTEVTYPFLFTK